MEKPPRYRLSEAEKDALLVEQAALIERLAARVAELEALVGKPRKTSANSHIRPSKDGPGGASSKTKRWRKPRPSRPGVSRPLADDPDRTERCLAEACPHCGTAAPETAQRCRHRYDHIDLPEVRPVVTRVELFGGRCGGCGRRYRAAPPAAMPPGTPFGPGIRALLAYLHHSHHVGFERLSRMLKELFGLSISEGAIANVFRRMGTAFDTACAAIKAKLLGAPVIASDETTTRIDGVTHWQWVFHSEQAVLHAIACGDGVVAPKIRDHLRWAIRVGKRRPELKDSTLATYAAKAERGLDALLGVTAAHPDGRELQRQIKAWRGKFFVFLSDRRVPPTNNGSEQEIRP